MAAPAQFGKRFLGPYHASQLVDFTTRCPYAFKLQYVEGAPEAWRHAKALLGDVVHYVLEQFHKPTEPGAEQQLGTPQGVEEAVRQTWDWLVEKGNPRYPDRQQLPMYWGRVREGDESRPKTRREFEDEWLGKAVDWVNEYANQPFNQDTAAGAQTTAVEISYQLSLGDPKKPYQILGRFDQIRQHYTLDTIPKSLRDQEGLRPGIIEELSRRLMEKGYLLEISDWKTTKDRPIFATQRDPWVVMSKEYQPRLYALGMARGTIGDLERKFENGVVTEEFVTQHEIGMAPDFYTWHWLPGYSRRSKGERRPAYKAARFTEKNPEPSDLYLPGKAPGDYLLADPRISILFSESDLVAVEKDVRRAIAAIRMGQYYRAPSKNNCTCCKFTRECAMDMEIPLIDAQALSAMDYDEEDGDGE